MAAQRVLPVRPHSGDRASSFCWLYVRHPSTYKRFRLVMIAMTLAGLVLHVLYPLAPPRMFPNLGFVDTGRVVGPASYGRGSAYSGFANQFAAMPSSALRLGARGGVGRHPRVEQPSPGARGAASRADTGGDRAHRQPLLARRHRRQRCCSPPRCSSTAGGSGVLAHLLPNLVGNRRGVVSPGDHRYVRDHADARGRVVARGRVLEVEAIRCRAAARARRSRHRRRSRPGLPTRAPPSRPSRRSR